MDVLSALEPGTRTFDFAPTKSGRGLLFFYFSQRDKKRYTRELDHNGLADPIEVKKAGESTAKHIVVDNGEASVQERDIHEIVFSGRQASVVRVHRFSNGNEILLQNRDPAQPHSFISAFYSRDATGNIRMIGQGGLFAEDQIPYSPDLDDRVYFRSNPFRSAETGQSTPVRAVEIREKLKLKLPATSRAFSADNSVESHDNLALSFDGVGDVYLAEVSVPVIMGLQRLREIF